MHTFTAVRFTIRLAALFLVVLGSMATPCRTLGSVATNGLVAYYGLDGTSADGSGHGYNGTVFSATATNSGVRGGCYEFDGNANAIVVYDTSLKNQFPAGSPITISAWVKVRAFHSSITTIAAMDSGRCIQTRASLRMNEFGVPYYFTRGDASLTSTLGRLPTNQWHLITGVQTGTVARLYIDGQLAAESLNHIALPAPSGSQFRAIYSPPYADISVSASIGAWTDWCGASESTFNGLLDEVRFYNRALNPAEVESLYNLSTTRVGLSITNARGDASPTNGVYTYAAGTPVTAVVQSPVLNGTTRFVCTGATVISNEYTLASATNVTLTLTNNTAITWNWQTEYQLTAAATAGGTVSSGGWYTAGSNTLLTAAADAGFRFLCWNDGVTNATRTVCMPTGGTNYTATFSPLPRGTLRFQKSNYSVNEGQNTVKITVERINGSYGPTTVEFTTANGTAEAGDDFSLENRTGSFSWTDGQTNARSFYIDIVDDGTYEGNELFFVNLTNETGAALAAPARTTVTIVDNDSAATRLPRFAGSLTFGAVATNRTASLPVEICNDGNTPLTVTNVTLPGGFGVSTQAFTVPAAESYLLTVSFSPSTTGLYAGALILASDATGGTNALAVSGTGFVPAPPAGCRSIQGLSAIISVTVTNPAACLGVEDEVAAGLSVVAVSDGGTWDATHRKLKWSFSDGQARTLTYTIAGAPGTYGVVGQASFDGTDDALTGANSVGVPRPFAAWATTHAVSGSFSSWNAHYQQMNGLVYALQSSLSPGETAIEIRWVNGVPMIDIPMQDPSTTPYVEVRLEGSTNLASGDWTMTVTPASDQQSVPGNRCRWSPHGTPSKAFFRLIAMPK